MSISRGWGPGLVTASWLNRQVMNGPKAWLWNGLQLLLVSADAQHSAVSVSEHTTVIRCIKKCKKSPKQMAFVDKASTKEKGRTLIFLFGNHCGLTGHWRFILLDLLLWSKSHLWVLWKITFFSPVCMFLHRSTSQSNLPGYHYSHSVSWPQQPPSC